MDFSSVVSIQIPVIDVSQWTDGDAVAKKELATAWDSALRNFGCVIIVNHGIPSTAFDQLKREAKDFFAMPASDKLPFNNGKYGNRSGGFTPMGGEAVARSTDGQSARPPDLVESFYLLRETPLFTGEKHCPIPFARDYFGLMETLLSRLHEISTVALGIEGTGNYFDPYYYPSGDLSKGQEANSCAVRLSHYPPVHPDSVSTAADNACTMTIRYGAHTDYLGFTILFPDKNDWNEDGFGGLEIELSKGEWIPVRPPLHLDHLCPLIINSGDLFQMWTNDRWKAVNHRVANPVLGSRAATLSRYSVVFFSGPMNDATICCIPELGAPKYEPVVCGEYLSMKLNRTNLS
jgi:isopenicillin N synthase-like dioxygenase